MKIPFVAVLLVALVDRALSQGTTRPQSFPLYRMDKSCLCIKTKKQTPTLKATEITIRNSVFQVFHSRSVQQRELFRVNIGTANHPLASTWWNYGIADEADFNGDGVPDYAWYGGDDTGFAMFLFLPQAMVISKLTFSKLSRTRGSTDSTTRHQTWETRAEIMGLDICSLSALHQDWLYWPPSVKVQMTRTTVRCVSELWRKTSASNLVVPSSKTLAGLNADC